MDLEYRSFRDIDLNDVFFNSLRESYEGFDEWYKRKAQEGAKALTYIESEELKDFLYLKREDEEVTDTIPPLPPMRRLKIGTFKIDNRGTKRGERFIKKILDQAIVDNIEEVYVTIFPEERLLPLINMFKTYGFVKKAIKKHPDGRYEEVYIREMNKHSDDLLLDYPYVHCNKGDQYILSIYPKFHTLMFPDSKLDTENEFDVINDISETNSIHKIYICWMRDVWKLKKNDKLVIYRTSDIPGRALYRSVATSVCTVLEVKTYGDFDSEEEFLKYMKSYSVFTEADLRYWYNKKSNFTVIKMLYNIAFRHRIIMKELVERAGIDRNIYWGFRQLDNKQFNSILKLGKVDERYIID